MTTTKNSRKNIKWLPLLIAGLMAAGLMAGCLLFAGVPALAAEPGPTTGETEASVSFTAGELKLDSVPALDFGIHGISHEEQVYSAVTAGPNVQVSDLRGKGTGWDLFASLSPFAEEEGGGPTLKAASISLTDPGVTPVNGTVGNAPVAEANVTLDSDSTETPLLRAGTDAGMGVWSLGWSPESIKLTVLPGTAQEGKSVATLTWSLQATP